MLAGSSGRRWHQADAPCENLGGGTSKGKGSEVGKAQCIDGQRPVRLEGGEGRRGDRVRSGSEDVGTGGGT